jgi:pimeloyl-ACP methyl ester carboxylesterase
MKTKKTTFVLVHGAWHGAWCFKRVAAMLRAQGHEVYTPTLTGLGESSHLLAGGVNLSTHVADVVNLLRWQELTDVVLCGHSYAGMVITGAVGQVPERVRSAVYVDAYLPEEGQSCLDMVPEVFRSSFQAAAASNGGLYVPAVPAELLAVNARDRAWVDAQCTPQPYATFLERVAGRNAVEQLERRVYVYADGWGTTPFTPIYERLKGNPAWVVRTAPCGHDVMIDMPELLAGVLLESA